MPWEILIHPEVEVWFSTLSDKEFTQVSAAIEALQIKGPLDTNIRIHFYFDKSRRAVLLVAGDKSSNWKDWYSASIKLAEQRIELKEAENG